MRRTQQLAVALVACNLAFAIQAAEHRDMRPPAADTFAAVQFAPKQGDLEGNRRALELAITEAAKRGARFVVLPELCLTGPAANAESAARGAIQGEPIPGPSTERFSSIAKSMRVWIAWSMFERAPDSRQPYVTAVLIDDAGRIARSVRKVMVRSGREEGDAVRGSFREIVDSVDAGGLRIGILSGDEIQAGIARLANRGVETILISAGWPASDMIHWPSIAAELGREYDVNLVIANRQPTAQRSAAFPRRPEIMLASSELPDGTALASLARRQPPWTVASALGLPASVPVPYNESPNAEIAELGRRLFFEKNLSSTGNVACASCHNPERSFTNGAEKGIGVFDRTTKRNVPSLLNVAFRPLLQWDGYASTLENFAKYPISGVSEMNFHYLDRVSQYLMSIPAYRESFRSAMGVEEIQFDHVARALATYQRTLISGDSAFDRFYYGGDQAALTPAARRGLGLFTGKAHCVSCHHIEETHALFTDFRYHVTGVGYSKELGRFNDIGLGSISTAEQTGLFLTPPLRNVAETAPYMHDGSLATLRDVIEFYERGGIRSPGLDPLIRPFSLNARERDDLIAFLQSLTGSRKYGLDGLPVKETAAMDPGAGKNP